MRAPLPSRRRSLRCSKRLRLSAFSVTEGPDDRKVRGGTLSTPNGRKRAVLFQRITLWPSSETSPSAGAEADDRLAEGDEVAAVLAVDVGHRLVGLAPQLVDLVLEPADLVAGAVELFLEGDDPLHSGQAHALVGQLLDPLEAVNVAVGVAPRPADGALRLHQALALVDAQRLGMDAGQLGRHRNDVERTVAFIVGHG